MYKSAICHLHSSFGGKGSISGFCYEAAKYGIDIVWLSDHDGRIATMEGLRAGSTFEEYDFSKGNPTDSLNAKGKPSDHFWEEVNITAKQWDFQVKSDEQCFRIKTQANTEKWQGGSIRFMPVSGTSERPLFSQPTYVFGLQTNITADDKDARLIIEIPLSQAPPNHEPVVLTYVLGAPLQEKQYLPIDFNENGEIVLPLCEDAQKSGYELDNMAQSCNIRIESRNGKQAYAVLNKFKINTEIRSPEKWAQLQREIGGEIGKKYGVTVLANFEMSHGERHMTYFGPPMPIYPYNGNKPTMEEMSAYAAQHGGIVSYNHPFSDLKKYKRTDPWIEVERTATDIIKRKASGATLIEIGFPENRHELDLCHNLHLWDLISLAGVKLYGIGVSDAHANITWDKGNNYANYIASPDCSVENLVAGMKKGNLYMTDPARFQGEVKVVTDQDKTMGDTQTDGGKITLSLTKVPANSTLVWILDGEKHKEETVTGTCESTLSLNQGKHFVRAELYDTDGRGILLTNPLWLS